MTAPVSINLRMPPELHQRVKAQADADRRSLNAEILVLLEHALDTAGAPVAHGTGKAGPSR